MLNTVDLIERDEKKMVGLKEQDEPIQNDELNVKECFGGNTQLFYVSRLFFERFQCAPNILWIHNVNTDKLYQYILKEFSKEIEFSSFVKDYHKSLKKHTIREFYFIFKHKGLLHFSYDDVGIYFSPNQASFMEEMEGIIKKYFYKSKSSAFEINLIISTQNGLDLTPLEVKKTKMNLSLSYEDDFLEIDKIIQKRLRKNNDKGIVLLHGLPGTGKTTYLRYLIGKINKKIMFVPPNIASNMTNPDFVNILINNPNSVLIIEDAENILIDRNDGGSSAVSNLLNISDGLLADCLNTQLICTFNISISKVDSALLRKGRLIAKYEFGKLSIEKSQKLSDSLGFKRKVTEPMTVAEIYNQEDKTFEQTPRKTIGFNKN